MAALVNRLKVVDWAKQHPRSRDERIEAPVVVIGMFRAGTTFLSNLLDQDPANRALLGWESQDSRPAADARASARPAPRVDAAQGGVDMLEMLNPAISAIHHEAAADPTECIAVMGQAFQSISWEAIANVPSYGAWWRAGDNRGGLRLPPAGAADPPERRRPRPVDAEEPAPRARARRAGRHLPRRPAGAAAPRPGRADRLGLQPDHTSCRARSPTPTTAPTSPRHWSDTLEESVDRIDDFRVPPPRAPDPRRPLRRPGPRPGRHRPRGLRRPRRSNLAPARSRPCPTYLAAHPRGEFGGHRYDVGEFGLTEDAVRERFRGYVDRYGVESERLASAATDA